VENIDNTLWQIYSGQ